MTRSKDSTPIARAAQRLRVLAEAFEAHARIAEGNLARNLRAMAEAFEPHTRMAEDRLRRNTKALANKTAKST